MPTIRNRLFPFHDVSDHNKISLYSLDQTGLAGMIVKVATGSANPQSTETDGFTSAAVGGVSYNGTYSNQYETRWKVSPTASGDTRYSALGVTELSTLNTDENGFILRYNDARAKEIGAVRSGDTVPVITKGLIGIWGNYIDTTMGPVQPGFLAVISRSGNGLFASVDPTNATNFRAVSNTGSATNPFIYDQRSVVGKWLTTLPTSTNTGIASEFSAQGGYAFLTLNCVA